MTDDFKRGVLIGLAMAEMIEPMAQERIKKAFARLHTEWKLPEQVIDSAETWEIGYTIGLFRNLAS
jgi:hypothetical protein